MWEDLIKFSVFTWEVQFPDPQSCCWATCLSCQGGFEPGPASSSQPDIVDAMRSRHFRIRVLGSDENAEWPAMQQDQSSSWIMLFSRPNNGKLAIGLFEWCVDHHHEGRVLRSLVEWISSFVRAQCGGVLFHGAASKHELAAQLQILLAGVSPCDAENGPATCPGESAKRFGREASQQRWVSWRLIWKSTDATFVTEQFTDPQ